MMTTPLKVVAERLEVWRRCKLPGGSRAQPLGIFLILGFLHAWKLHFQHFEITLLNRFRNLQEVDPMMLFCQSRGWDVKPVVERA